MEWLKKIALVCTAALAPIKMMLIAVGLLVIFDLVTGMWAARRRGETLKSSAMRRTISKMLIYQLTVISGFLLETYLLDGLIPVAKLVAGVIGMVEFKSILENASTIAGEDIVNLVMSKLGSDNDPKVIKPAKKKSKKKE
jgi:membrane glycosyltransferase